MRGTCQVYKIRLYVNSPARSRKRKWIRFERLHSNAMQLVLTT